MLHWGFALFLFLISVRLSWFCVCVFNRFRGSFNRRHVLFEVPNFYSNRSLEWACTFSARRSAHILKCRFWTAPHISAVTNLLTRLPFLNLDPVQMPWTGQKFPRVTKLLIEPDCLSSMMWTLVPFVNGGKNHLRFCPKPTNEPGTNIPLKPFKAAHIKESLCRFYTEKKVVWRGNGWE